ncbi:Do family serine endopeptidase [Marinobacterium aestuariivivens]|uniref:Do family serine endopeptidase n=1 Tax=Marinobacterium aestuariivivens TaxID=1698799 RepID=A0ABW2A3Y0_9GAMM
MKKSLITVITLLVWLFMVPAHAVDEGLENLRQTGKAFASVARLVSPSVVFVQVESKVAAPTGPVLPSPFGDEWPFGDDFFERFFGEGFPAVPRGPGVPRGERRMRGQGSGFVFASKDGLLSDRTYILTNNHVVENAEDIEVTFQDGRQFDAVVTGRDPQSDLAVIEIAVGGMPELDWADSQTLEVGEWVVAIGNPFGLNHTLTVGVVSAKGRTSLGINDYEDFIQTDAAINPGNSGGPLVNLEGKVVGINTAIFSRSGGYMGVGFAIPSNLARVISSQLIEDGEVTRGYLGVVIQQLTADLAESFGIEPGRGVVIAQVSDGSPAQRAGLRQGDVVLSYRGEPVTDVGNFRNRVSLTPPGTGASLTVLRDGERKLLSVTIGRLDREKLAMADDQQRSSDEIGLTVQTLTPQLAEKYGGKPGEGVVVTDVQQGSIASMAGIEPGTLILQVDRKTVNSAAEFERAVRQRSRNRLLLLIREQNVQRYLVLSW